MRLFSQIHDYHSKLEDILESKVFSANVKNLLLSMIYKIEVSYRDYRDVKRIVKELYSFFGGRKAVLVNEITKMYEKTFEFIL